MHPLSEIYVLVEVGLLGRHHGGHRRELAPLPVQAGRLIAALNLLAPTATDTVLLPCADLAQGNCD